MDLLVNNDPDVDINEVFYHFSNSASKAELLRRRNLTEDWNIV